MRVPLFLGLSLVSGLVLGASGLRAEGSRLPEYPGRTKAVRPAETAPTQIAAPPVALVRVAATASAKGLAPKPAPRRVAAAPDANVGLFNPETGFLKRGPRGEKTLVLTFDDGPFPDSAERMLDTLKELDVKATFFVVGERVLARPDLVRRMIAEGHEVANHTHEHKRLHQLSTPAIEAALQGCEDAVRQTTGRGMTLMRPPGMRYNDRVLEVAHREGYVMVGYNSVAGDFVPNGGLGDLTPELAGNLGLSPQVVADRIDRQIKPGTIVLLHDNPVTVDALPTIVARARAKGYRFVTTAELMDSLPHPIHIVANPVVDSPERTTASVRIGERS